jgi:hypothetical protein
LEEGVVVEEAVGAVVVQGPVGVVEVEVVEEEGEVGALEMVEVGMVVASASVVVALDTRQMCLASHHQDLKHCHFCPPQPSTTASVANSSNAIAASEAEHPKPRYQYQAPGGSQSRALQLTLK